MEMIHLVTDSTAYLPPETKSEYGIHTISLKVIVGDRTYDEEGGLTKDEFYRLLADVATAPTTSQPSAGEFMALYEKLVGGDDEVISIHISEPLSGTVPNARAAARELAPDRIHVVDSRSASIGLLVMVTAAAEALRAGKDRAQVLSLLERMIDQTCVFFSVETLEYLHKGGRIGAAARFLGTLLNIKPILYLHEGRIQPLDKVRTSKRARRRILDEVVQAVGQKPVRVAITHIQCPDAGEEMAARAREALNCVWLNLSEAGPVVGSHVGPGTVGIAACPVGEDGF
jgi:DegV family protein with EDD domain